jgi:glycerol-3-phosphate dehydrogenase
MDSDRDLLDYDVVVVGAGIIGSMIARELSRYKGRFALVEKEPFPGWGVSKGSLSMIHAPDFCPPGTLKGKLCLNAPARFKRLSEELEVAYREVDELWLALDPSQIPAIEEAKRRGESHGGTGFEIIGGDRVRELEPHVNPKVAGALYIRGLGVVHPPEWAFALMENAAANGIACHLNTEVLGIEKENDRPYLLRTSKGDLKARWIVNAAGLFADEIASMAGDRGIELTLTKGTMAVFKKSASHLVRHMVYGTFSKRHSQAIAPTVHGNTILGLGYFTAPRHKNDYKVEPPGIQEMIQMGKELIPSLSEKDMITTFAGIRSENNRFSNGDFYIAPSGSSPGVIHAIINQPGLTAAPAVADLVIELLSKEGFLPEEKKEFQPRRRSWPVFSEGTSEDRQRLIRSDSRYGRVVCRCEQVTEGEIIEAIRRGADTLDGIRHVTRAGMGCCQGGFCSVPVFRLLAKEANVAPHRITKKGRDSSILAEKL